MYIQTYIYVYVYVYVYTYIIHQTLHRVAHSGHVHLRQPHVAAASERAAGATAPSDNVVILRAGRLWVDMTTTNTHSTMSIREPTQLLLRTTMPNFVLPRQEHLEEHLGLPEGLAQVSVDSRRLRSLLSEGGGPSCGRLWC